MISRIWHGWARRDNADAYEPSCRRKPAPCCRDSTTDRRTTRPFSNPSRKAPRFLAWYSLGCSRMTARFCFELESLIAFRAGFLFSFHGGAVL